MAHFAELNDSNVVQRVVVVADAVVSDEAAGIAFLQNLYGADTIWKQTSYNTYGKKHYTGTLETSATIHNTRGETLSSDQSKAFRGNFAQEGGTWDSTNNIFIPPRPTDAVGTSCASWTFNTTTALWTPPITFPTVLDDGADPVVWVYSFDWYEAKYQANNARGWNGNKHNADGSDHSDAKEYYWNGSAWAEAT